jgi:hypothetical protein
LEGLVGDIMKSWKDYGTNEEEIIKQLAYRSRCDEKFHV